MGLLPGQRLRRLGPAAGEHEAVLGAGHRHVEQAHPLGGLDHAAVGLDAIEAGSRRAEQAVFEAVAPAAGLGAGAAVPRRRLVELEQVDVLEVEPLGAMDGEHLDRVLGAVLGAPLLGLAGLGHAAPQGAQDGGGVAAALLDGGEHLAEEALQVGQPVGAEVAGRLGGLDQGEPAQALDEDVRRLGLEGAAEDGQMLDGGQQVAVPAAHALDPRHVFRHHADRPLDRPPQGREGVGSGRAQLGHQPRELPVPERDQGGVGHPHGRGAEHGEQRQVVARIEHRAHQGGGLDDLAAAVVLLVAADGEGDAGAAEGLQIEVEVADAAQQDGDLAPGDPVLGVEGADVFGEGGGLDLGGLGERGLPGLAAAASRRPSARRGPSRPTATRGGSRGPPAAGRRRRGARRGAGPRPASVITGSITRATSSRITGTERKLRASDITSPPASRTRFDEAVVGPQVGVAPAVDRLLGVADQEEAGALLRPGRRGRSSAGGRTGCGRCPGTRRPGADRSAAAPAAAPRAARRGATRRRRAGSRRWRCRGSAARARPGRAGGSARGGRAPSARDRSG